VLKIPESEGVVTKPSALGIEDPPEQLVDWAWVIGNR